MTAERRAASQCEGARGGVGAVIEEHGTFVDGQAARESGVRVTKHQIAKAGFDQVGGTGEWSVERHRVARRHVHRRRRGQMHRIIQGRLIARCAGIVAQRTADRVTGNIVHPAAAGARQFERPFEAVNTFARGGQLDLTTGQHAVAGGVEFGDDRFGEGQRALLDDYVAGEGFRRSRQPGQARAALDESARSADVALQAERTVARIALRIGVLHVEHHITGQHDLRRCAEIKVGMPHSRSVDRDRRVAAGRLQGEPGGGAGVVVADAVAEA